MIVAVTGATGYAGQFIVRRLVEAGTHVRAWRRPSSDVSAFSGDVEWIAGDLRSPDAAASLVRGTDALVHAALEHVPGRYRGGEGSDLAGFIEANVGGSLRLLQAARDAGVGRCVFLSSRAVFGAPYVDAPIADDEPPRPDTHYGAAKASVEAFVRSYALAEGWAATTLRPTGIYGLMSPVARSKWFGVVQDALQGRAVAPRYRSEVHASDVAESVRVLLEADADAIRGRAFNCSDIVVSTRDVVAEVQKLAGVEGPLPEILPAPTNVMASEGLAALGIRFGGMRRFEETVAELVQAAQARGGDVSGSGPS